MEKFGKLKLKKMKLVAVITVILFPLFSLAQANECNWRDLKRLGDKIKDSIVHSQDKINLQDTSREEAALYLTQDYRICLKGKKIRHIKRLLGNGNLYKNSDSLIKNSWTYKLEYTLREYNENGVEIMNGIPSSLYVSFDKKKRAMDCYMISY